MSTGRVTVDEFAGALNWTPTMALTKWRLMGLRIEEDWAGRPSISTADAARGYRAITAEIDEGRARALAADEQRAHDERLRAEAEQAMLSRIRTELRRRGQGDPVLYAVTGRALERVRRGEPPDKVEREVMSNVEVRYRP